MRSAEVLIVTAMQMEAQPVARALGLKFNSPTSAVGAGIRLEVVGISARRMPALTNSTSAVILAGLAGGLDPALRSGDVVIDDPAHSVAPDVAPGARRAVIYGADHIIASAAEKAGLFRSTAMSAVDMESSAVRAAAAAAGVPFINIRAVVDTAGDPLDPETVKLFDESGRVKLAAAMKLFLRRPHVIPALLKTRHKAADALASMARVVADVVHATFA